MLIHGRVKRSIKITLSAENYHIIFPWQTFSFTTGILHLNMQQIYVTSYQLIYFHIYVFQNKYFIIKYRFI